MSNPLRTARRKKLKTMQDQQTEASTAPPVSVEAVATPAPFKLSANPNGATVFVEWKPETMSVLLDYDRTKVTTLDFIIGMLEMALLQARTRRDITISQNMQKRQHEAMKRQQEEFETQMMAQRIANENQARKIHVGG